MNRLALVTEQEGLAQPVANETPAVVVVDDDRRCVEANAAACDLLGRSRPNILGRRFEALVAPEMSERIDHFWQAFPDEGGHAGPFEVGDGVEIEISVTRDVIDGRHLLMLAPTVAASRRRRFAPASEAAPEPSPVQRASSGRAPSARECEVLRLLAAGETDPQIAGTLGLSPATVQTHVRNAKAKLGARTRAQAVAMAIARELISPPAPAER